MEIKKVVIPAAGLATRFLPLSKAVPKEFLPLADIPMAHHIMNEVKASGISQVVFVMPENNRELLEYFKAKPKLENVLKKRGNKAILEKLKMADKDFENISFLAATQKEPKGDGHAILQAQAQIKKSPFGVMFIDDIFEAKVPAMLQLKKVFSTCQKPVIGLKKVSDDKLSSYGVVKVEKIANRLYKIKEFIEKPKEGEAPSNLAVCGRYALPSEIFSYLEDSEPTPKGEIILANVFKKMLGDGKILYGYDLEGDWLECGKTIDWMKSNMYFCLKHPEYGPILRQWLKHKR